MVLAPAMAPGINTKFAEAAARFEVLVCCATDGSIRTEAISNIVDASTRLSLFIALLR